MGLTIVSSCNRFSVFPGRYSIFRVIQNALVAGGQQYTATELAKLQRKLKQGTRKPGDAISSDGVDLAELASSHRKLMEQAQKDLLTWRSLSMGLMGEYASLAHGFRERRLVDPIPQHIPRWAAIRKPLAGVYWMACAGEYLSNGQVREISLAFRNKHITDGAIEWLRTPESGCRWRTPGDCKVDSFIPTVDEWWGELATFFADTAKAGSGAAFG